MAIELAVSRAITQIHALEMAVHSSGLWMIGIGKTVVQAHRSVHENHVSFTADFPAMDPVPQDAFLGPQGFIQNQQAISWRPITPPAGPFRIVWELGLPAEVAA